ncbi:MAG: sulfatase-like hydrolase/transferase [Candidatus Latescibacterota bacterium]|nr:sulfatase-like hydrolase/transferase [Candidatus Latescibacterota bacterium]
MSAKRPNVLFILTDDQGPWAAGCYGNDEIRTPGIDRIAEAGLRFDQFFCASPVCSPSRATFLTGRLNSQHGVHDWIRDGNTGERATTYLEGEVAYTDVLAEHGYTCGFSGKWHLGNSKLVQHGFGHWYVHQRGGGDYNEPPMIRDGELITESGYVTNLITNDAVAFLDRHARDEQPFYLGVHYTAPHSPWTGHPQDVVDSYDNCAFDSCPQEPIHPWAVGQGLTESCLGEREMLKGYFAAVTAMDADVWHLLDRLEALGIRDETLVVFTSDNGFSCGHHGFWGKGNGTWPLNFYENSVRIPFLMSHPGSIRSGMTAALTSAYDFFPTLLDYLGLPEPEGGARPGISFAPLLTPGGDDSGAEAVLADAAPHAEYGGARMVRTADWMYVRRYADSAPDELYNLNADPGERTNLADDSGYRSRVDELGNHLESWFDRYAKDAGRDGRRYRVTGNGQLRPVGGDWEDTGRPPFVRE